MDGPMKPTARIVIEVTRFDDDRIVADVACNISGETLHASEEFGPFATMKEVVRHAEHLALGFAGGAFPEVILSEFSAAAGVRFPPVS